MKKTFRGTFTAIITPFTTNGEIDWKSFEALVEQQVEAGIAGIVPCGTTGEAPTLSITEQHKVIKKTVEIVSKRALVIPGSGSNCTKKTVEASQKAQELGADGCMLVTPYYNKPTQKGLYQHFATVASSVELPIIIYNVEGRSSINIELETTLKLIEDCPTIVGIKEASGNIDQIKKTIEQTPDQFSVLSGDDKLAVDVIELGGSGLISVASNIIPKVMVELIDHTLQGRLSESHALHEKLLPVFQALFIESNPIPIKAALSMKGGCQEAYRLPLCSMEKHNRRSLNETLLQAGIL